LTIPIDETFRDGKIDKSWIVSNRTPTSNELTARGEADWMRVETGGLENPVKEFGCKDFKHHVTQITYAADEVDLFGGTRIGSFLPDVNDQICVSDDFKQRLAASNLTGMDFVPLKIKVNQASDIDPVLFTLVPQGQNCRRPLKCRGVANACPFCGLEPLICPNCGYEEVKCTRCGQITRILSSLHKGEGDRRLRMAPVPKDGYVLDGRRWDGSDFVNCGFIFITKRALDSLLSVHAAPFVARPACVCIDGMSDKQLAQLEAAKKPVAKKGP
jgi:hypothetical protein